MNRTAVINVVGLSPSLLGPDTPCLQRFASTGATRIIEPAFPAVTCTAQSNYLTGKTPDQHGVVGNGWYHRELAEVQFWKQSNHVVRSPKIWDELKRIDPAFTCAKLFWWYNMYASADYTITPRPMYPADGRKVFDVYASPFSIRPDIKKALGDFPFPSFWGPLAGIESSEWIAASAKWIEEKYHPTLNFVYLPHLDYDLQRFGPGDARIPEQVRAIDRAVGDLIGFFHKHSIQVLVLSEYGISRVSQPVHLNRLLRQKGWVAIKDEMGLELLDAGASQAFAVADHQVAHVYINNPAITGEVRRFLESLSGVETVLGFEEQRAAGIRHERAGDLVVVSKPEAWFTYYYWLDDSKAPDFARTVDIHRKPGYDPVELFMVPYAKPKVVWKLFKKKLGFRILMDVIPLDARLVKGSHGARPKDVNEYPILISDNPAWLPESNGSVPSTVVYEVIKRAVVGNV